MLRCASALACSRTLKVRSAARSSRALPLNLFEQPPNTGFFNDPSVLYIPFSFVIAQLDWAIQYFFIKCYVPISYVATPQIGIL